MNATHRWKFVNVLFAMQLFPMAIYISTLNEYVGAAYFGLCIALGMIRPTWFNKLLAIISLNKLRPRLDWRLVKKIKQLKYDIDINVDKVQSLMGTAYVLSTTWDTHMSLLERNIIKQDTLLSYNTEAEAVATARDYRYQLIRARRKDEWTKVERINL
jgi:hypothetical protein